MNKTVKRALLIAGGVVAACGIIWGGLTLAAMPSGAMWMCTPCRISP